MTNRLLRASISFLIGALATVGAAYWGWTNMDRVAAVTFSRLNSGSKATPPNRVGWIIQRPEDNRWVWYQDRSWCVAIYSTVATGHGDSVVQFVKQHTRDFMAVRSVAGEPPSEMGFSSAARNSVFAGDAFTSLVTGFPLGCFRASWLSRDAENSATYTPLEGFPISRGTSKVIAGPLCNTVPTHLLPLGLAVDVFLFSVVPFLLLEGLAWPRRKRGSVAAATPSVKPPQTP
jgi:hypothetical protein